MKGGIKASLVGLGAAIILGIGVYFGHNNGPEARLHAELIGTQSKFEQLSKYTAKLESDYKAQKDLWVAKEKTFAEVISSKEERIRALSDATYLISRHSGRQNGPDYFFETPGKTQNYIYDEIRLAGPDSPPVGFVLIKSDGRTYKGNYAFEIEVLTLQTVDEATGKVKIYSKAFWIAKEDGLASKRRPDLQKWSGVKFPLEIIGGSALIDPTAPQSEKRFLLWAPHINGGVNLGLAVKGVFLRPSLDFSFSGYGRSRNDLDWKFAQLGVGASSEFRDPDLHFSPFTYRLFPHILTNTYFGPGIGWARDGLQYFLNTSVGF